MKRMQKRTVIGFLVFGLVALLGWVDPGNAYDGGEVTNGGTITGKVKWAGGTPPAKKTRAVEKDKEVCGTEKSSEELLVSSDKGIKNAVVSLVDIKKGKKLSMDGTPRLDQQGCVYKPHVQIVSAGAMLEILNNDGILHNVHTTGSANPPLNIAQPKFKKKIAQKFDKPEPIKFDCDVHSWMRAWAVVAEHPYYAVTDENGAFKLADVPPGTYQLKVWHESLEAQVKPVTVKEKGTNQVDFELK